MITKTSKPIREIEFFIPVQPIPASRPRVSVYAKRAYYGENYQRFRDECKEFLKKISKKFPASDNVFKVEMEFICYKPKKPTHEYPRGDLDNFLKGPLDCLTQSSMLWVDDMQIIDLRGTKRYQEPEEPFGIKVIIKEYTN